MLTFPQENGSTIPLSFFSGFFFAGFSFFGAGAVLPPNGSTMDKFGRALLVTEETRGRSHPIRERRCHWRDVVACNPGVE